MHGGKHATCLLELPIYCFALDIRQPFLCHRGLSVYKYNKAFYEHLSK